jgi:hypothetical protein
MSEPGGVLAFPDPRADDELMYDLAFSDESDDALAKKWGYKDKQGIHNKRWRNKERITEIREPKRRQLESLHAEKFEDLLVMKPLARMAGFDRAWQMAWRKLEEINARSYNPITGEAHRQSTEEARQFKIYYDILERAAVKTVELSEGLPGRLGDRYVGVVAGKHRDPKPAEQLEAERAERERDRLLGNLLRRTGSGRRR